MIWAFLKEYAAWICFFLVIVAWMNIAFVIDSGFSSISIYYFNVVNTVLFFLFLSWRYIKERSLMLDLLQSGSLEQIKRSKLSSFQALYIESFMEQLVETKATVNELKVQLQEETDDLLAWVHEVKAPLTALKLMIEQVKDLKLKTRLEHEWLRVYLLLDQQLHLTRLQTIEKDNRMEKTTLRKIVYQEIREMQAWCMEKGIGIDVEELGETVVTDKKWAGFIVRQLLSNAVKYSPSNEEIRIFTTHEDQHVLLHIKDKGIGIKKDDFPRIFHKSYTGTVGRESAAATGMGLYLAKNAAHKLGIQIEVISQYEKGTQFTLRFPIQNEYIQSYGM
ncbi:sensor histidine kinase [Solibacillus sp. FSL H8-0538]|uniref:sensor histidine kinase n=1 Tax=Solibacillus sp. FSL H8-0538 TaxID=2921400 RepID=UPI0030F87E6B